MKVLFSNNKYNFNDK